MASQEGTRPWVFGVRVGAPPKERTAAPVPEPQVKPAPVPFEKRREKPPPKKRLGLYFRLAGALLAMSAGGTAIQHHIQEGEPLSPSGIMADVKGILPTAEKNIDSLAGMAGLNIHLEPEVAPYNPDSTKAQTIKAGTDGNARPATPEEIENLLNQTPPAYGERPKHGEQAPKIKMILPVNPEDAKRVNIRISPPRNAKEYQFNFLYMQIRGDDVPFYLPLMEGAKKADVKTVMYSWGGISGIELRYYLADGKQIAFRINFADLNFTPTPILESTPQYNPNIVKTHSEVEALPAKEFYLNPNSRIDLFHSKGTTNLVIMVSSINATSYGDSFALSPSLETSAEGVPLYLPSPSSTK